MGEILSAEEAQRCNSWTAERSEMWRRLDALFRSHEALRAERDRLASLVDVTRKHREWAERSKDAVEARLAEVEAERDELRRVFHACRERSDENYEGWLAATARLAEVEQALRTVVAVAGNVVLVDDEADLLVPDWRAVVEVLREAIDTIRAALDKGEHDE